MEPMSKEELLSIIDEMGDRVGAGDSFEGFLNYLLPFPDDDDSIHFRVEVRFRVGNSEGQGGMKMIGVDTERPNHRYREYPGHPLYEVPQGVIDSARSITRDAGVWKDMDAAFAEPIADAVVARIIERGFEITRKLPPD